VQWFIKWPQIKNDARAKGSVLLPFEEKRKHLRNRVVAIKRGTKTQKKSNDKQGEKKGTNTCFRAQTEEGREPKNASREVRARATPGKKKESSKEMWVGRTF